MKKVRTIVVWAIVAGATLAVWGPADAQVRTDHPAPAGTVARVAPTLDAKAKTPIEERTKTELTRRMTLSWNGMTAANRLARGQALWGLYRGLADPGPVPHITPRPPVEPPATTPCTDCGKRKAIPNDPCDGLRARLKDLLRQQESKGLVVDLLQAMIQGLVDMEFYGGVADLVVNMTTTAVGLATAGGGAALGRAAATALKNIAVDQIKGAILDALAGALPPPLDSAVSGQLTQAGLSALIANLVAQLKVLDAEKVKVIDDLNKCAATYKADVLAIETGNATVINCRRTTPNFCL